MSGTDERRTSGVQEGSIHGADASPGATASTKSIELTDRHRHTTLHALLAVGAVAVALLLATFLVSALTLLKSVQATAERPVPAPMQPSPATGPSVSEEALVALRRDVEQLRAKTIDLEHQSEVANRAPPEPARRSPPDGPSLSQIKGAVAENTAAIKILSRQIATPAILTTSAANAIAIPTGAKASVRVFFGTDRAIRPPPGALNERFSADRGSLAFGTVNVSVPAGHVLGKLEQKFWWFHDAADPGRFFVAQPPELLNRADFTSRMKSDLAKLGTNSALVFVHGFNVSFEDAALRSAQMAYDLDMRSLPIFFSWPSQSSVPRYTIDEQMAEWAESHLRTLLEAVADESMADSIIVLAHSMGSRPTTRALRSLLASRPELRGRFKEIILAAPDIDADVFKNDLMPPLIQMQQRITLYASSGDRALAASRGIHGAPRAGDAGAQMVVLTGIETLDASGIDTDFLGHSYYGSTRALLTDINLLVHHNVRAPRRPFLEARSLANVPYWVFKP